VSKGKANKKRSNGNSVKDTNTNFRKRKYAKKNTGVTAQSGPLSSTKKQKSDTVSHSELSVGALEFLHIFHSHLGALSQIITTNHYQSALSRKQISLLTSVIKYLHLYVSINVERSSEAGPFYDFRRGTSVFYKQSVYFALYASKRYPSICTHLNAELDKAAVCGSFLTGHQAGDVVFRVTGSSVNRALKVFDTSYAYRLPEECPVGFDDWGRYLEAEIKLNRYGGEYDHQNSLIRFTRHEGRSMFCQQLFKRFPLLSTSRDDKFVKLHGLQYPNEKKMVTPNMVQRFFSIRDSLKERPLESMETLYSSIKSKNPFCEMLSLDEQACLVNFADSILKQFYGRNKKMLRQPVVFKPLCNIAVSHVMNVLRNWSSRYPFILGDFLSDQHLLSKIFIDYLPPCLTHETYISQSGRSKGEFVKVNNISYVLEVSLVSNNYSVNQDGSLSLSLSSQQRLDIVENVFSKCELLGRENIDTLILSKGHNFVIRLTSFNQLAEVYNAFVAYNIERGMRLTTDDASAFSLRWVGEVVTISLNDEHEHVLSNCLDLSSSLRLFKAEFPRSYLELNEGKPLFDTVLGRRYEMFLNGIALDWPKKVAGTMKSINYIFTTKTKLSADELSRNLSLDIKTHGPKFKNTGYFELLVEIVKNNLFNAKYLSSLQTAFKSEFPKLSKSTIKNRIYTNLAALLLKDVFYNSSVILENKTVFMQVNNNAFRYCSVISSASLKLKLNHEAGLSSSTIDDCNKCIRLCYKAIYSLIDKFCPNAGVLNQRVQSHSLTRKSQLLIQRCFMLLANRLNSSTYINRTHLVEDCTAELLNEFINVFRHRRVLDLKNFHVGMKEFLISIQAFLEIIKHSFKHSSQYANFDVEGFLSRFYLVSLCIDKIHSYLTSNDCYGVIEPVMSPSDASDQSWLGTIPGELTESDQSEASDLDLSRLYSDDEGISIVFARDAYRGSFFSRMASVVDAMETGVTPSSAAKFFEPSQLKGVVFNEAFTPLDVAQVGVHPN
jgi:hypothetical protein